MDILQLKKHWTHEYFNFFFFFNPKTYCIWGTLTFLGTSLKLPDKKIMIKGFNYRSWFAECHRCMCNNEPKTIFSYRYTYTKHTPNNVWPIQVEKLTTSNLITFDELEKFRTSCWNSAPLFSHCFSSLVICLLWQHSTLHHCGLN